MLKLSLLLSVTFTPLCFCDTKGFNISKNPDDVHFVLYPDRKNPGFAQEIKYMDTVSLLGSKFACGCPTILIMGGFLSNGSDINEIKNEILKTNFVGNVIIVRWDDLNGNHHLNDPHFLLESIFLYAEVVKNTQVVARRLADFLLWIREVGNITPDLLHLIGHSLGAHTCGECGLLYQQNNSYGAENKLKRISGCLKYTQNQLQTLDNQGYFCRCPGLDPAGPLYFPPVKSRHLEPEDAHFVDVYHTNSFLFGDFTVDGHVNFYINGGVTQPGCNLINRDRICMDLCFFQF